MLAPVRQVIEAQLIQGPEPTTEEQRSFDAQRSRELSERQPVGVTIGFKPTHLPTMGGWNYFLCILGAAILIAVIVVNMI